MTRALLVIALLAACREAAPPPPPTAWSEAWLEAEADRYLGPTTYRRAALEASLVNPTNIYSRQRLASYGRDTVGWDALPIWNPRSRPVDRAIADGLTRNEWPALPSNACGMAAARRRRSTGSRSVAACSSRSRSAPRSRWSTR